MGEGYYHGNGNSMGIFNSSKWSEMEFFSSKPSILFHTFKVAVEKRDHKCRSRVCSELEFIDNRKVNQYNSVIPNALAQTDLFTEKYDRNGWLMDALALQVKDDIEYKFKEVDCGCEEKQLQQLDLPTQHCMRQKIDFTGHLLALRQILLNREFFRTECDEYSTKPCQVMPEELYNQAIEYSIESVNACLQYAEEMITDLRFYGESLTQLNICLNLLQRNTTMDAEGVKGVQEISEKVRKLSKGSQVLEVISLSSGLSISTLTITGLKKFPIAMIISMGLSFQSVRRTIALSMDRMLLQKHKLMFNDIITFLTINYVTVGLLSQKVQFISDFIVKFRKTINKVLMSQFQIINGKNAIRFTKIMINVVKNIIKKPPGDLEFGLIYNKKELQSRIRKNLGEMFQFKKYKLFELL